MVVLLCIVFQKQWQTKKENYYQFHKILGMGVQKLCRRWMLLTTYVKSFYCCFCVIELMNCDSDLLLYEGLTCKKKKQNKTKNNCIWSTLIIKDTCFASLVVCLFCVCVCVCCCFWFLLFSLDQALFLTKYILYSYNHAILPNIIVWLF